MPNFKHCVATVLVVLVATAGYAQGSSRSLRLELPRFEVVEHETLHFVMIPGGQMLAEEEGRPRVPYYVEHIDIPRGQRVQDVTLASRSEAEETTGLRLTPVILDMYNTEAVTMKDGLYPDREHSWRVIEVPGGASQLLVAVYPFDYDPATTEVSYYRSYDFEVEYVESTVELAVDTDKPEYGTSESVQVEVGLLNAGEAQDVTVDGEVVRGSTGESVARLPEESLVAAAGSTSVVLDWRARGIPTGDYYVDVKVSDAAGKLLDKEHACFRLGVPGGELTGFAVEPEHFELGDRLSLSIEFENTGSTSLSGQAVFEVRAEGDSLVHETRQEFDDLGSGFSKRFEEYWDTGGSKEDALYSVVGYVLYEATATPAERVAVSTNAAPSAAFDVEPEEPLPGEETGFDATASTDEDGEVVEYRWEFGDGGEAVGDVVTHTYREAGQYGVRLTVTDDGGRTAVAERVVVVGGEEE